MYVCVWGDGDCVMCVDVHAGMLMSICGRKVNSAFSAALFAGNEQLLYVTDSELLNSTRI